MTAVDIVLRDIDGQAEMRAVEELQKEVWGVPDLDVVPLTQLVAAKASGGVLIGAFDGEELIGFAYGFAGFEEGHVTHHSHMLAVKAEYRSFNVGYRLKLAQREKVLEMGIDRMTWTFDPLQSLNAWFNFNKLGVVSDRYHVNFYGEDAASFLHRNGTDRLWVTWLLNSQHVIDRLVGKAPTFVEENVKFLLGVDRDQSPILSEIIAEEEAVMEIPADINELEKQNSYLTAKWREATRAAFSEAIAAGYLVNGFYRGNRGGREIGIYRLQRGPIKAVDI